MTVNPPGLFTISQEQIRFLASEPVAVVHPKMKLYSVPANLLSLYFFSGTQKVKF